MSSFALALREALLGLPTESLPVEARELRAELGRLQALARRLEAHETDLEEARKRLTGPWKSLLEEALPKLRERLSIGGLQDVFRFQGLLEEVLRRLTTPVAATLPEGLQAQEVARLQVEVIRLLETRRRSDTETPPLKARLAQLETQLAATQEEFQRMAREAAEARAERDQALRDAERARKEAVEAEWKRALNEAAGQSGESKQFQEQFNHWKEKVAGLERDLEAARQSSIVGAQDAALARDDLQRSQRRLAELERQRRELDEGLGAARQGEARARAAQDAAQQDLKGVSERESVLRTELAAIQERLAAAQGQREHEHSSRLELAESLRRLQEQAVEGARLRAGLEARLEEEKTATARIHDELKAQVHEANGARGVEREQARARIAVLEETLAQRGTDLERTAARLAAVGESTRILGEALERAEGARRQVEAEFRGRVLAAEAEAARLAVERDRAAKALEETLEGTAGLSQALGRSRRTEKDALDRVREIQDARRKVDNELESSLAQQAALRQREAELLAERETQLKARLAAEKALAQSEGRVQGLVGETAVYNERVAAMEQSLSEAHRQLQESRQREGQARARLQLQEAEAAHLRQQVEQSRVQMQAMGTEPARLRQQMDQLQDALGSERTAHLDLRHVLKQEWAAREKAQAEVEALQREAQARQGEVEAQQRELEARQGEVEARQRELAALREELAKAQRPEAKSGRAPGAREFTAEELGNLLRNMLVELRTTLTSIRVVSQTARGGRPELERALASLGTVEEQVNALGEFLQEPPPPAALDVATIVDGVLGEWSAALSHRAITVERHIPSGLPPCPAHAPLLTLAIHHLITNAYQAMPQGGTFRVELSAVPGAVNLRLTDTGPAFPGPIVAELGAPSAGPAKPPYDAGGPAVGPGGGRSGLGLSMAARVAASLGGQFQVANGPQGGVEIEFTLPASK